MFNQATDAADDVVALQSGRWEEVPCPRCSDLSYAMVSDHPDPSGRGRCVSRECDACGHRSQLVVLAQ